MRVRGVGFVTGLGDAPPRPRCARALARPVSPFPPRRHRRGAARFASKGDDGSSASPGSSDASPPEGPSFAEAREKFKRDFWDEVANDPGGVPFLKPRDGRGGPRRGDPGAKEGGATEETSGARADPESGAGTTSGHDRRRESFWSRCTLAGLALGVWFGVWGLTSMHWPTVAWTAKHPRALAWSVDLGWSVLAEVARRLAAPALRLLAAWFAMRSRWALALVAAVGAFAAPGVEA